MLDETYYSVYKNSFYGALLFSIVSEAEAAWAAMCLDCAQLSILFDLLVKDGSQRDSQWDERQIECREGGREGMEDEGWGCMSNYPAGEERVRGSPIRRNGENSV